MVGSSGVGKPTVLLNPAYHQVTEDWFIPSFWGEAAVPVSSGGRGGAWFISSDQGELVLRHYRRGGFIAHISEASYLYAGAERVRSIAEFKLLDKLYLENLPVPQPVAACFHRSGFYYQAALITERIMPASPLGAIWKECSASVWSEVGRVVREFHDHGIYHADLNCFNILMKGSSAFLIDFDKAAYRSKGRGATRWKRQNLARLYASLTKELHCESDRNRLNILWNALERGYEKER